MHTPRFRFLVIVNVRVRGCGPNMTPPERHKGDRADPARARPVPFCFHGFLFEKATSDRPLQATVP